MSDHRPVASGHAARRSFGALLMWALSGCALIHDDGNPEPLPLIEPEQIRLADTIQLARDGWPSARWWTAYGDEQLDALITRALEEAPSMAAARSQVEEARARVGMVQSVSRFQMAALATVDRMRVSDSGPLGPYASNNPILGTSGPWYTTGFVGGAASYKLDIWGKERDQVNAAIGLQNAQLAEAAAIELEISTGIAQLYFDIQSTLQTLDLLQQSLEIATATVAAHTARASRGLEARTLTEEARSQQLAIESQIVEAKKMVQELREALRALVGAGADDLPELAQTPLPQIQSELPATLSYELLARRPDLQAMRWYVQASFDEISAAEAAFYPSFDITSLFGYQALRLEDLFRTDSVQFNLIGGLRLPLFDGGRLNANLRSKTAASNTAVARYNQAVLNAVRDVAVAGTRLQALDEREQLQLQKLDAVTFAEKSAGALYQRGLANKVIALNARLPVIAEEIALVEIRGQQINQAVALVKALGGGYQADQPPVTSGR